jgi:hypothetical protein
MTVGSQAKPGRGLKRSFWQFKARRKSERFSLA